MNVIFRQLVRPLAIVLCLVAAPPGRAADPSLGVEPLDYRLLQGDALASQSNRPRSASDWLLAETIFAVIAGLAANEPEAVGQIMLVVAPINYLLTEADPSITQAEITTTTLGFLALGYYNYKVDEDETDRQDIFITNFLALNLMVAISSLFDGGAGLAGDVPGSSFAIQADRELNPYLVWNHRFQ